MQGGLAAYLHAHMKTILSAIACCLALATAALAGDTKITHADGKEAVKLVAEKLAKKQASREDGSREAGQEAGREVGREVDREV